MTELSRRDVVVIGAGATAVAVTLPALLSPALAATEEDVAAAINEFTGGKAPATGRVTLRTPEIAENGNTVPVEVIVESPMTADDHVASVLILADGNPNPGVATFHFSPASGEALASTRIRLAKTQNILAVAKMSNGDVFMEKREGKVTIGGCGG